MLRFPLILGLLAALNVPGAALAQPSETVPRTATQTYVIGMVVKAERGGLKNLIGTMTVPMTWPDQQKIVSTKEMLPRGATVKFETVDDLVRRMTIRIPLVAANTEARAVVAFEIEHVTSEREKIDPKEWSVPQLDRNDRKTAAFLLPSPFIESDKPAIKTLAEEITAAKTSGYEKATVILDWVAKNIQYQDNSGKAVGVLKTLDLKEGDCDEKNSLAVALCRAAGIPARLVRSPSHSWHEFYLTDTTNRGRWFTADATSPGLIGKIQAGHLPLILQKGDRFDVQDPRTRNRVKQRFLEDTLVGLPQTPGAQAKLQLICQTLDDWEKKGPLPYRGIARDR